MTTNKALLLLLMGFAVGSIGVALLMRGTDDDSPRQPMEGLGLTKAQLTPVTAAPVELSRAPATDPRKSEGLAPPSMTTLAGAVKLETEQDWAVKYAGLGADELNARQDSLQKKLIELASPELKKRQQAGQLEFLHPGRVHHVTAEERELYGMLSIVQYPPTPGLPDGDTRRVVLPESEYPALYAMRNEIRWLEKQRAAVERDASMSAKLRNLGYSK